MRRPIFLLLAGLWGLWSITAQAVRRDIHILSCNDMHASMEVFPQLAALIDSLRTVDPGLLVFSAGDNRTGNPLNDKYEIPAYPMVALMNQVGFNASAIGNHEFDAKSLGRLIGLSNFRYICANMFAADSSDIRAVPCQVFDVEGVKVGVVGVIQLTPKGIPGTHPDNLRGVWFSPAFEVIGQYEYLRKECDVTILLSHLGWQEDVEMAKAFPWLDLIIGGHTHTQLKGDEVVNNVLITQNKKNFANVTYTTLTVDNGKVTAKRTEYIDVRKFPKKDKLIEAMVQHFSDNPMFREVLATAVTPCDEREEVGCMICDAFIDGTQADVSVENSGGVRLDTLPVGDISVHDVLKMDPFDNNIAVLELTGDELVQMMLTYCNHRLYSFPYVGGMKCELTLDKENPKKVKSVKLLTPEGKKMNMKRKYRVATNSYVTATSKVPEGSVQILPVQTTDIIMNFLRKKGTISYKGVIRLKVKEP